MKVPLSWLRDYVDVTVEPETLAHDLTLAGLELGALERAGGDAILDLEITTNRVDCMNIYGVAREAAVLYGLPLKPLATHVDDSGPDAAAALKVVVEAPDLCPRFCARVLDVRLGESPDWIKRRLEAVGVRPINNVVDLTNYVMMEMGHPTHAFDLAKIPGAELRVRWARAGERLVTLDGVERELTGRCGVVGSAGPGLALAGVMGGASSEVSDNTRMIALEAAYWTAPAVRRAAKDAGVATEASHRFERGADPEAPPVALARIAHLLAKIGAGSVRPGLIDVRPVARVAKAIGLRPTRLRTLLGAPVAMAQAKTILAGLGFSVATESDVELGVEVPSWRGDVAREVDLIEEVGRHVGLDKIPATLPAARGVGGLRVWQSRERALRDFLVGAGFAEVIGYAFVDAARAAAVSGDLVPLANPLAEDQGVLRRSLVVPGLLGALTTNLRQGRRDVALFETGRVFHPNSPLPKEERRLGILLAGEGRSAHWSERGRAADFFDLTGVVQGLAARLGAHVELRRPTPAELPPHLHPGRAALVLLGDETLGSLGCLHPDLAAQWDLRQDVFVAEISIETLLLQARPALRYRPLDRFPAVLRDLSIVCSSDWDAREIGLRVREAAGDLLQSAGVVDRYVGTPVPEGKVSLTFALRFQSRERTLTSAEIEAALERVIGALRSTGAEIRSA
jgi:phenylalanyl-tRNA synthetase beta chain